MVEYKKNRMMLWMILVAMAALSGCGSDPPVPAPAPPAGPGYGYGGVGNCGAVGGGQPLQPGPINATLTDQNSTVIGSIQLSLFLTNQYIASDPYPSVVGSGSISFTNASSLFPYPMPGQQTSFCISTTDPNGGGQLVGVYSQQDSSLAVTMKGLVNLPSVDPYSGMPSGAAMPEPVTVSIGYDCATQLSGQTRFQGCVRINLGSTGGGTIYWAN